MTGLTPILVTVGVFVLLAFLSMPVAYALGLASIFAMVVYWKLPMEQIGLTMVDGIAKWTFLAVPMFLLAGELMEVTGITDVFVDLARSIVGRFRGGLSHVCVVVNVILAGMSGSAVVDLSATAGMLIPAFKKVGYPPAYAAVITSISSLIGPIIPPSVPMIFYSLVTGASIARLFLAGVVPGFMMAGVFIFVGYLMARKYNFPVDEKVKPKIIVKRFGIALPALLVPIVIVGGLRTGLFTATEGGGILVAVVVLAAVAYRRTEWDRLIPSLRRASVTVAAVLFIVALSTAFAFNLSLFQMGPMLSSAMAAVTSSKIVALIILNVILLVLGCFMDLVPIILIFGPIMLPIATHYGVDPIQFGLIMVLNTVIGLITPPYGLCMLMSIRIADTDLGQYFKFAWPFLAGLMVILGLVTYVPAVTLWLPNLLMGVAK